MPIFPSTFVRDDKKFVWVDLKVGKSTIQVNGKIDERVEKVDF